MAAKPKPMVFLSHVREDAEHVELLASGLEARGIGAWIDRHKIKPGKRWEKAIKDAIRSGGFFIACFSQAYAARSRSYMNEELHLASEEIRRKPLDAAWFIPLRLDVCEIPDWPIGPQSSFASFQRIDMFPDWAKSVEHLAETILPSDAIRTPWYPVRLDPILANVEGWPNVAKAIARRLKQCELSGWLFVIKPLDEPYEPDEMPYPDFFADDRRIEFRVRVEPVIGRQEVTMTAEALFDLLLQYLEQDFDDSEDQEK